MEFILDRKSTTEGKITVKVAAADYEKELNAELKKLAKTAQINGFRPGKVPPQMIKKMYGGSVVSEVVFHVINHKCDDYFKEQDLNIIGGLSLSEESPAVDWVKQTEFELVFEIAFTSDFELDLSNILLDKYEIEVSDAKVEDSIKDILEKRMSLVPTDIVTASSQLYIEILNGTEILDETKISAGDLTEKYTEFFVGKETGFVADNLKVADVFLPDTYQYFFQESTEEEKEEILAGEVSIKITTIEDKIFPQLNEEFFKEQFPKQEINSEEEFKATVKEEMRKDYQELADDDFIASLNAKMLESVSLEMSEKAVRQYIYDSYEKGTKGTTKTVKLNEEDIDKLLIQVKNDLTWQAIKNKLSKTNEFKITDEDVEYAAIEILVVGMPFYGQFPKSILKEIAIKNMNANKGANMNEIAQIANIRSVLRVIAELVPRTTHQISSEQFTEILKENRKQREDFILNLTEEDQY